MQTVQQAFEIAKFFTEKVGESTQNVNGDTCIIPQYLLNSFDDEWVKGNDSRESEKDSINMHNEIDISDITGFNSYLYSHLLQRKFPNVM